MKFDFRLVIVVFFIAFKLIQVFGKMAKENAARNRPAQAGRGGRRSVQSELEDFLNDVGSKKPPRPLANETERTRDRRLRRRQEADERQRAKAEAQREREEPRRLESTISDHVDSYINQHVDDYMDDGVNEYVDATIVDSVEENLGDRNTEMPQFETKSKRNEAAEAVVKLMKDPVGVRNAILVNEILSPPRALRK